MNHEQVVMNSASKAALRASNALNDLHAYLLQLKGSEDTASLLETTQKVTYARELVHQINAELANTAGDRS